MFLRYFLLALVPQLVFGCTENSICKDFKEGKYKVVSESVHSDFEITRTSNSQIEKNDQGDIIYYVIKWVDECSYISKFDETKMTLNDEMKMINSDGGLVVELLEVSDKDCISFQSYVKDFKELSLSKGKFCRIGQ
ncbi:MAG: hypothetical protein AB3N18_05750 [Allomuricauda sp.]